MLSMLVGVVPDVGGEIAFIGAAPVPLLVSQGVDGRGPVRRANGNAAKGGLQRLQKLLTQALAVLDGQIGLVGNVGNTVKIADFAVQEVPHEECA